MTPTLTTMNAQLSATELPVNFTFESQTAVFRQTPPPLSTREEVMLSLLAREIVDCAPELARRLAAGGRRRLLAGLVEA
jgi:hypothetical protein